MAKPHDQMLDEDVFAARQEGGYVLRRWLGNWCDPVNDDELVPASDLREQLTMLRPSGDTYVQSERGVYELVE